MQNGTYKVVMKVLKALGDPANPAHRDVDVPWHDRPALAVAAAPNEGGGRREPASAVRFKDSCDSRFPIYDPPAWGSVSRPSGGSRTR